MGTQLLMMPSSETGRMLAIYAAAAFFEIAGCFTLWAVLRLGKSAWWMLPGLVSLLIFAALLTRIDVDLAGRAYADYGGITSWPPGSGCGASRARRRIAGTWQAPGCV